jgi:hypothetical protein
MKGIILVIGLRLREKKNFSLVSDSAMALYSIQWS